MRIEEEHGYISGGPVVKVTRESINGHKFDTARRTSLKGEKKRRNDETNSTGHVSFFFKKGKQHVACS